MIELEHTDKIILGQLRMRLLDLGFPNLSILQTTGYERSRGKPSEIQTIQIRSKPFFGPPMG